MTSRDHQSNRRHDDAGSDDVTLAVVVAVIFALLFALGGVIALFLTVSH
jgi:hypothetical protein